MERVRGRKRERARKGWSFLFPSRSRLNQREKECVSKKDRMKGREVGHNEKLWYKERKRELEGGKEKQQENKTTGSKEC